MEKVAIRIENINKTYIAHDESIRVFKDYNMTFEYGKFYAIMGHSGCGKSTLIKIMGLLESSDSGLIFIDGENVSLLSEKEKAQIRNQKVGFIFQDYLLDDNLNVFDNILLLTLLNKDWQNKTENIRKLTKIFNVDKRCQHYPKELSGGECQRVAMCRALINDPKIILADEPTGNLDKKNEINILDSLKYLSKQGKCVIVVSHSDVIKNYADKVINLEEGN